MILCFLMLCLTVLSIITPQPEGDDGSFRVIWSEEPTLALARNWEDIYAMTLVVQSGEKVQMDKQGEAFGKRQEVQELAKDVSTYERSVECVVYYTCFMFFFVSLPFFIAACASYYPTLLDSGAVDVVLSKPLSRLQVFFGKYAGGMMLLTALLALSYTTLFVGIGLRTGVWQHRIATTFGLHVLSAGLLFAMVALPGVRWRSTALAMTLGLIMYFVVDFILDGLMSAQRLGMFQDNWPTLDAGIKWARTYLPNFGFLRDVAVQASVRVPVFNWSPVIVASSWLAGCLGLGYWSFRRADYS